MSSVKIVIRKREMIVTCVSLLLFFQIYLQNIIPPVQFLDEVFAVVFFLYFVIESTKRIQSVGLFMLMLMICVLIIGVAGNYSSNVQTSLKPILTDMGNCIKVFMIYLGAKQYIGKVDNKDRIVLNLARVIRCFVIVLFVCSVLQMLVDIGMGDDVRFGIRSFRFINNSAGQLSVMMYTIITILTIDLKTSRGPKNKMMYIAMALFAWCMTLRSRAFMFVVVYVAFYYFTIKKKEKFKFNFRNLILVAGIAMLFCMDQVEAYFGNENSARANLLKYGIVNLRRFFPIGSGFATFGTDAAAKYYSELYYEYGIDTVYGMTKDKPMFASDTYWGAIFGQLGFLGTIAIAMLIFFMMKDILKNSKHNKYCYLAGVFIVVTQVVSSVATATFFNFVTVGLFFCVPLMFDESKANISEKNG